MFHAKLPVVVLALTGSLLSVPLSTQAACLPSSTQLCLLQGRFAATLKWSDGGAGGLRDAFVATPKTDSGGSASGLFYFYDQDPDNWEVLVKMIDGCRTNGRFWTLVSASTGFRWRLEVVDTSTGTSRIYEHPLDGLASGVSDFAAFSMCSLVPPSPTPVPARVRYLNDATCGCGVLCEGFTSILQSDGFSWTSVASSFQNSPSPYQAVQPGALGPFSESNETNCLNAFYDVTFPLAAGRRYTLVQSGDEGSGRDLGIVDEGPVIGSVSRAFLYEPSEDLTE